jgi:hypothetical protein
MPAKRLIVQTRFDSEPASRRVIHKFEGIGMNRLIDIAKANGAWLNGGSIYFNNQDQLRATVEQVCAPLVEALQAIRAEAYNKDDGDYFEKADLALMNHRALIGDKHE